MARVEIDPGIGSSTRGTFDRSAGHRYSILGPVDHQGRGDDNGHYVLRDHEIGENIMTGTREEMIAEIERIPARLDVVN